MVSKDLVPSPFRWEFIPLEEPSDRSVRWTWRAYSLTGALAIASDKSFDTLTECMNDARNEGYSR